MARSRLGEFFDLLADDADLIAFRGKGLDDRGKTLRHFRGDGTLLFRGGGDLLDLIVDVTDHAVGLPHGHGHRLQGFDALGQSAQAGADTRVDLIGQAVHGGCDTANLVGRLCGFFSQLLDLIGDHGEAASRLARARRFDSRVQRE